MTLRNPCKKCVVKACCQRNCKKHKKFKDTYDSEACFVFVIVLAIAFMICCAGLTKISLFYFLIWPICFTITMIHICKSERTSIKEFTMVELLIAFGFSPVLLFIDIVSFYIDKVITKEVRPYWRLRM